MHRITVMDENGVPTTVTYRFEHFMLPLLVERHRRYQTLCYMTVDRESKTRFRDWPFVGFSVNSTNDQWVRRIGIIKSFSRALQSVVRDRALRKKIFNEFWKIHGVRITGNKLARVMKGVS